MIDRHPVTDHDAWLEMRRQDVTASMVGGLFEDVKHPYATPASIFAHIHGVDTFDADSMIKRRGRVLEPIVAAEVGLLHPEWKITKATEYLRDPEARIGATPDFYVECPVRGRGVLQTKTVASSTFKRDWLVNGEEDNEKEIKPPLWILLQALTEAMLDNADFMVVGALVVGDFIFDPRVISLDRDAPSEARIRTRVERFWADVDEGRMPAFDPKRDGDIIRAMWPSEVPGKIEDWTGDEEALELLQRRASLVLRAKDTKEELDAINNTLRAKLGDTEGAEADDGWIVTLKTVNKKAYSVKANSYRELRAKQEIMRQRYD